jgi:hypothetical protein
MNEISSSKFKKRFVNYFEVILSSVNSLIIIFLLIIAHKNIILSIIGILFACINLALIYYIFIKNNPMYRYYCYVLLFSGILFFIPSLWIDLTLGSLFLPNIIYIIIITKRYSGASAIESVAKYHYMQRFAVDYAFNAKNLSQQWDNINPELELKRQKHRELLEKKYHSKKIIITSILLSFIWLIIFLLYVITFITM